MLNEYLKPINENDSAVQSHLTILQSVIQRMATNSNSAKTWCVTIVSAILVTIADKSKPNLTWLCLIPIFLFFALDAYYLSLELGFRESYNFFIKKLHSDKLSHEDLFIITPRGDLLSYEIKAFLSFSIWGFYSVLIVLVITARFLII